MQEVCLHPVRQWQFSIASWLPPQGHSIHGRNLRNKSHITIYSQYPHVTRIQFDFETVTFTVSRTCWATRSSQSFPVISGTYIILKTARLPTNIAVKFHEHFSRKVQSHIFLVFVLSINSAILQFTLLVTHYYCFSYKEQCMFSSRAAVLF